MKWQRSSSGPDWTDVITTIRAIEETHSVSVLVAVSPAGGRIASIAELSVSALPNMPVLRARVGVVGLMEDAKSGDPQQLVNQVYRMLLDLDRDCSKLLWTQEQF